MGEKYAKLSPQDKNLVDLKIAVQENPRNPINKGNPLLDLTEPAILDGYREVLSDPSKLNILKKDENEIKKSAQEYGIDLISPLGWVHKTSSRNPPDRGRQ